MALNSSEESTLDVYYPQAGVDRSGSTWVQPVRQRPGGVYYTTPQGENVRASDPILFRFRGGSRAGTTKSRPGPPTAGSPLQGLFSASFDPRSYLPNHPTVNPAAYPPPPGETPVPYYDATGIDGILYMSSPPGFSDRPFSDWSGHLDGCFSTDGAYFYVCAGDAGGPVACRYSTADGSKLGPVLILGDIGTRVGMTVSVMHDKVYFCANDGGSPVRVTCDLDMNILLTEFIGPEASRTGAMFQVYDQPD